VIVGDDLSPARAYGPYDLVLESVGGKTLATALTLLASGGTCVTIGWSAAAEATIDVMNFVRTSRTTLYGLIAGTEPGSRARSEDLVLLGQLVARQQLKTYIEVEASWHDIGEVAQRLLQRQFTGKAVLHLT
jgi:NADPH:quinone reductase-like Zn-dependent oxidoreductase